MDELIKRQIQDIYSEMNYLREKLGLQPVTPLDEEDLIDPFDDDPPWDD